MNLIRSKYFGDNTTTNNDKTVLKMGAMINTNRSVVIRLQQIMCSQKIYSGVVIRQLQIMCSNKTTVPKIMCS
jgi:hypothetical protein